MRRKAILTIITALALLVVWVPTAEARTKWVFGNGQTDLAFDPAPGFDFGVCTTHVTGGAGVGTSVDPAVTPPPPPPTTGFTVEIYAGNELGGATHSPGQLTFPLELIRSPLLPLQTVTTAAPTALNPPEEYADFQDNPIWQYASAEFAFNLPAYPAAGSIPPGSEVVIAKATNSAFVQTTGIYCTTTTLSSSANPSNDGEAVTFTATVNLESGQPATQFGVDFLVDGTVAAANVAVNASGQASYTTSSLTAGDHEVTANYLNQFPLSPSTDSLTQTVGTTSTDDTPPTFGACTGGPFSLNSGTKAVSITATDEPGGSGLNAAASTLTGSVRTGSVGAKSVTFTAQDNAGNTATKTCHYRVNYVFSGFFEPVDNGLVNVAKAGKTVPFRFAVSDAEGTPVTNVRSATKLVTSTACISSHPTDSIEYYTTGSAGLKNLGNGRYQFNFRTYNSWNNTCRTLGIKLADGVHHVADFQFKR